MPTTDTTPADADADTPANADAGQVGEQAGSALGDYTYRRPHDHVEVCVQLSDADAEEAGLTTGESEGQDEDGSADAGSVDASSGDVGKAEPRGKAEAKKINPTATKARETR